MVALAQNELASIEADLDELERRGLNNPLAVIEWLPGQLAFLSDASKDKLARWGQQFGKTTVGLSEGIYRCLGAHPYLKVPPPPIEGWIICASWSQSLAVQKKLWELLPKDQIVPGTRHEKGNGFGGKSPCVVFLNGSLIRIKTTNQGGLQLSAATIDWVMFDEPPKTQRIFFEVRKRVMRRAGVTFATLTPVNAPTDWLKERAEKGLISDHHYKLTPENMIPVGRARPLCLGDGTPMDAAWIAKVRAETPFHEAPVVLDGEWEMKATGRIFASFKNDLTHVYPSAPGSSYPGTFGGHEVKLCLGVDHGRKIGKQYACLVAVVMDSELGNHRVYVLDEHCDEVGDSAPDDDAKHIIEMLDRHGIAWHELDYVFGDRVHLKGSAQQKSNLELAECIARRLKLKQSLVQIATVKQGEGQNSGSVDAGIRFLHHRQVGAGQFAVNPRCAHLVRALNTWEGDDDDQKDKVDALRYALWPWIFSYRRIVRAPTVLRR